METEFYTCEFCQTKFKPKRRKAQKFCSSTCRVKNHHHKNRVEKPTLVFPAKNLLKGKLPEEIKPTKIEEMSVAGVANSATGTYIIQLLTNLLTKFENKSATKGDIQELKNLMRQRYFQIHNMDRRYDGALPYFDMATSSLVYLNDPNYKNPANYML